MTLTDEDRDNFLFFCFIMIFFISSLAVSIYLYNTMADHKKHGIVDATPWFSILIPPFVTIFGTAYILKLLGWDSKTNSYKKSNKNLY